MTRIKYTKAWKAGTRRSYSMAFFDPSKEIESDFTPLNPGRYRLLVQDLDIKTTKKGDGRYVAVVFTEQVTGKKVWMNFNIENPNAKAQQIGRGQLKSFLAALGHSNALESENDLYKITANKSCHADLVTEVGSDGKTRNRIAKFVVSVTSQPPAGSTVSTVKDDGFSDDKPVDVPF